MLNVELKSSLTRQNADLSLKGGKMKTKLSGLYGSLFKRSDSKIWWISLYYKGQRYRFSTKTDSQEKAELILDEIILTIRKTGTFQPFKTEKRDRKETKKQEQQDRNKFFGNPDMTYMDYFLKVYLPYCEGRQASYKTKKYVKAMFPSWFMKLRLNEIGLKEAELMQSELIRKGYKPATINKLINIFKHSFTKLVDWEILSEDRLKAIRKVKMLKTTPKLRYLQEDEIERLLQACDAYLYGIVLTALHTGMRKGEILDLKWQNVDLKNGIILIEKTKTGYRREIPISDTLKAYLKQLFVKRRLNTDYVFVNPETGKRFIDLKRSFNSACKKAGLHEVTLHTLRHTFASQLVMAGVDIKTVSELLGHQKITTTMIYAHLSSTHKRNAISKLDEIMSKSLKIAKNG